MYLWSDDNLSNDNLSIDYFWRYLSYADRELMASHPRYGRVCCFKGFDAESFAFNTRADPELFDRQFGLFADLLATGMDVYGDATFTSPNPAGIGPKMSRFVDRLQEIAAALPLRVVPLEIEVWGPVAPRMRALYELALSVQVEAVQAWNAELAARFSASDRSRAITDVRLPPAICGGYVT